MGQGDPGRQHQGGVIRATPAKYSITPVPRMAVCPAACRPTARFRTDRAGLSKSKGCIGKPLPAAALTIKGYLAHWQTGYAEVSARHWQAARNDNKQRQWGAMIRRRKRRAIALGRRAFESGSGTPDARFEGDS
jgi:hypothetical protein